MKIALIAALAGSTNAWFGTGHLLVARIAENILEITAPEQLAKVEAILKILESADSKGTKNEGKHAFVECATYADDFKYHGGFYQKEWHFIDQPYLDEGGKISDYDFTADTHPVTEAINGLIGWTTDLAHPKDSYIKTTVEASTKGPEQNAISVALRLLIHYVGDIHQPLHATSRVDHEYPKGDFGGNTVHLPKKDGVTNLHALWDSVGYEFSGYAKLPFSDSNWALNGKRAADLVERHPLTSIKVDVTNLDPKVWADESFEVSESFVYAGVQPDHAVPSGYAPEAATLAEERIVIAGHRLANLIMKLNLGQSEPAQENLFLW